MIDMGQHIYVILLFYLASSLIYDEMTRKFSIRVPSRMDADIYKDISSMLVVFITRQVSYAL